MSKDFRRRLCALISAYILLIGCYLSSCNKKEVTYNPHYKYQSEDEYAYYNGGKIYICNEDTIDRIRDDETRDIYVIDQRFSRDPNMRICNSYEIVDIRDMNRILNVLLKYEEEYPSPWNRDFITMRREWIMHNFCYYFEVEQYRTAEVDLNNGDENKYLVLKK